MIKNWSSYGNSFLRHLESHRKFEDSMTMYTLSERELQLALEAILTFVKSSSTGKAKIEIHHGEINMNIDVSKEMSS